MKRVFSLLTAASMLLLMSGCAVSDENDLSVEERTTTENITSEITTGENTTNSDAIPIDYTKYEIFKGLPKSENPISTVNCKYSYPSLLCYGDGNTYFMWDGTVYKHSGTETVPLFDKNAYNLNYYDGKLYFIEDNDYDLYGRDLVRNTGFLYSYDLETKSFEQITDYPICWSVVTDDGLFWTEFEEDGDITVFKGIYRHDLTTGLTEYVCQGYHYMTYGGYNLTELWDGQGSALLSDGNKEYLLKDLPEERTRDCISGDYYYFYTTSDEANHFLNRLSMLTGEVLPLKLYESAQEEPDGTHAESFVCIDYTVLKDEIYFIDDTSRLRKYDESTDSYVSLTSKYVLKYVYSDEENLYGVAHFDTNDLRFVKITLKGNNAEMEILA